MTKIMILIGMLAVGLILWGIGSKLNSDAIAMGIGVLFGVMAGIPTALILVLSRNRRDDVRSEPRRQLPQPQQQPAAPIFIFGAPPQQIAPPQDSRRPLRAGSAYWNDEQIEVRR